MTAFAIDTGSSEGTAIADDTLKDIHVAGWLNDLAPTERERWLERVGWIRRVDRMAEAKLLDSGDDRFTSFVAGWERLRDTGILAHGERCASLLQSIQRTWFDGGQPAREALAFRAFGVYVDATSRSHQRDLVLGTIEEYERLLRDLSGSILLSMPDVPLQLADQVASLGAVDQLYNDIRDLMEDGAAGVCRFPSELLEGYGLCAADFFDGRFDAPGIPPLLEALIAETGARLRARQWPLVGAASLHPTWRRLVREFNGRHDLIETTLMASGFDVRTFTDAYWDHARQAVAPTMRRCV